MELVLNIIYLLARYMHIVCTTLLVGGTLFYEMVVPLAIADLKPEQQMIIFARARWVFKRIVVTSVMLLILSGIVSTHRHWDAYVQESISIVPTQSPQVISPPLRPGWWWAAHASCGCMALLIAYTLTAGSAPPTHSVRWMRMNLVILLTVIFLGAGTQQLRQYVQSQATTAPASQPAQGAASQPAGHGADRQS